MPEPLDLKKWQQAKALADEVYEKHSAYKSGFIVKKYKQLGGTFAGEKTDQGLSRWFAEKWTNQRGGQGYEYKSDIYRPTNRINSDTPSTWSELTTEQIKKARKIKSRGLRIKKF